MELEQRALGMRRARLVRPNVEDEPGPRASSASSAAAAAAAATMRVGEGIWGALPRASSRA